MNKLSCDDIIVQLNLSKMSTSDALKSDDPVKVRAARCTVKGQITKAIKSLGPLLSQNVADVSQSKIQTCRTTLKEQHELFDKIHAKLIELATPEKPQDAVIFEKTEEEYYNNTVDPIYPILDALREYDKNLAERQRKLETVRIAKRDMVSQQQK